MGCPEVAVAEVQAAMRSSTGCVGAIVLELALFAGPGKIDAGTYKAKITAGDFNAARIKYGNAAAAGQLGRDVLPIFTSVEAYDYYYRFADDKSCHDECVRSAYTALRKAGSIKLAEIGTAVVVQAELTDPKDATYKVCRVRVNGRTAYLLCAALSEP